MSYHAIEAAYSALKLQRTAAARETVDAGDVVEKQATTPPPKMKRSELDAAGSGVNGELESVATPLKASLDQPAMDKVVLPVSAEQMAGVSSVPIAPEPLKTQDSLLAILQREGEGKIEGLHTDALMRLSGMTSQAVHLALHSLVSECLVCETIDEEHFQAV